VRAALRLLLTLLVAIGSAAYLGAESRVTLADSSTEVGSTPASSVHAALGVAEGSVGAVPRALVAGVGTPGSAGSPAPGSPPPPSPATATALSAVTVPPAVTTTATATPAPAPVVTVTVTVLHDGASQLVTTTATTVGGMLAAAGIGVHPLDKVSPPLTAPLAAGATIRLVRVTQTTSTKTVTVNFTASTRPSASVELGTTQTAQVGHNGTLERIYVTTYEDGRAIGTVLSTTKTLVAMRPQITLIGTGQPAFVSHGHSASGAASWYGTIGLDAASPDLPFGTVVHVIDTANGRTINVRIEDRGPAAGTGRIIDLSPTAFGQLAPLGSGVVPVTLEW
jgi:rare lipoprotein A